MSYLSSITPEFLLFITCLLILIIVVNIIRNGFKQNNYETKLAEKNQELSIAINEAKAFSLYLKAIDEKETFDKNKLFFISAAKSNASDENSLLEAIKTFIEGTKVN